MIIHEENIHRVFLGEMLSFIKKHETEIIDVSFGVDLHVVVVELKGNDRHGFQLQSELYFRSPGLWGHLLPVANSLSDSHSGRICYSHEYYVRTSQSHSIHFHRHPVM